MEIHAERLLYVIPLGLALCYLLDLWIWHKNREWLTKHPGKPRHPYSPLFTAIGVTITCLCIGIVSNWVIALFVYGAFTLYGGFMWILHGRRWWFRN